MKTCPFDINRKNVKVCDFENTSFFDDFECCRLKFFENGNIDFASVILNLPEAELGPAQPQLVMLFYLTTITSYFLLV